MPPDPEKLGDALRENMLKRKVQARAREEVLAQNTETPKEGLEPDPSPSA